MSSTDAGPEGAETPEGVIYVRFWASVRAAAGTDGDAVPVAEAGTTLEALEAALVARHPGGDLGRRLLACAVLVGSRPVGSLDPAEVRLSAGDEVEFLPPFAGG